MDSDGSIGWQWNRSDAAIIPGIRITQRVNDGMLVWLRKELSLGTLVDGNTGWSLRTIKTMKQYFVSFFYRGPIESCLLQTSKRLDAHLMRALLKTVTEKRHLKVAGKSYLVGLRQYLHWGSSMARAFTLADFQRRFGIDDELYATTLVEARATVANAKQEWRKHQQSMERILADRSALSNNLLLDGWQVLGFFIGDGGASIIWGSKVITCVINFTGDRRSAKALELYAYSLFRDIRRKAWKAGNRNASRLIVNGTDLFVERVIPFFNEYPIPPCRKRDIVNAVADAAVVLYDLKYKPTWTQKDKRRFKRVIEKTWDINPSGPSRRFGSACEYYSHVLQLKARGEFGIR